MTNSNFKPWVSSATAEIAKEILINRESSDEREILFRNRLLNDARLKEVWSLLEAQGSEKKLENIKDFILYAPKILCEGFRPTEIQKIKERSEGIKERIKFLETLDKELLLLKELNLPQDILLNKLVMQIPAIKYQLSKILEQNEIESSDQSWLMGLEFDFLENLKKSNAKNFDETYSFVGIGVLFDRFFGQNHSRLIGETVMAMKGIDQNEYDPEALRSRVDKAISNARKYKTKAN